MNAVRGRRAPVAGRKGGGGKSKGGGGSATSVGTEIPDTLASRSIARIIDLLGEGEIGGLVDGLKSVYLDRTPVMNADGTLNFKGFNLVERTGTPDQDYVAGMAEDVGSEVLVDTQVKKDSPVTRAIEDPDLDAVLVKVRIPRLLLIAENGGVSSTTVEYAIDLQPDGGSFSEVAHETLKEKFGSPCEFQYRIALPVGGAPWTIRVRRLTDDSSDSRTENDTWWSTYTQIIDSKLSYPNSALMGLEVDAKEFGSNIPDRAYEIIPTLIEVPANYDPETREYATTGDGTSGGLWDGTFKMAATENPTWWLRWLMIEPRYGCGDHLPAGYVDQYKFSLYTIAQYCDGMVPDGRGGTEPRFTFNYVIGDKAEAYDVLRSIASVFRGFIFWGSGAVCAVADMPGDPEKLLTPANVIDGTFNYEGVSDLARHSVALVTWNDPADGYRTAVEVVEDPDAVAELGWVPLEVLAYGCTSRGQAHRMGLWSLDTEKNENQTGTWSAGWDQADVSPGGLVAIADPVIQGFRGGGRVAAATTTEITIDAPVTLALGASYEINVIMADGLPLTRAITNPAGATAVLDLADALPEAPAPGAVWTLSSNIAAPRPFRVLHGEETEKHIFAFTALQHDPTKYARIENGVNLAPQIYSAIPTGAIMPPRDLSFTTYLYQVGPEVKLGATLHWSPPDDPRVVRFEAEVQRSGDANYDVTGSTAGLNLDVKDVGEGPILARVRALDALGRWSTWAPYSGTITFARPATPTGFRIALIGNQAQLTWDPNTELNFRFNNIRFSPVTTGAIWESAIDLVERVYATTVTVPAMSGTYLIKAVNSQELESLNAALIVANLGPVNGFNAVDSIVEQPTFAGTKTDVVVIDDTLQIDLDADATEGTYLFEGTDLGAIYASRISALIDVSGRNAANVMSSWVPLSSAAPLSGATPGQYEVLLEVSTTLDDPGGSPVWTDYAPMLIGDYLFRKPRFKLTLFSLSPNVTPVINRLEVSVDMADRIEQDNDVTCSSGGITITYANAFRIGPAVSILGQGMATGDYFEITAKSETGFTVRFFNSSGTGVARDFDWIAKGGGIVLT